MPRFASVAWTLLFALLAVAPGAAQEKEKHRHKIGLVLGSQVDRKLGDEILGTVTDVFAASKRFVMIERYKLEAIFTEKDLQRFLGNGNPALSEMLGLDLLGLVVHSVETKVTDAEKAVARVVLDVRLVDVTNGVIFETLSSERPYSLPALTLREAGNYLSETLREKFPLSGYVVEARGKEVIVDLGIDDGLKEGAFLEVVRKGEQIIHPVTHIPLPAEWIVTGELKVVFVSPAVSTCWLRWGEDIEPGSLVFLKEEFSPFPSLIEPKAKAPDSGSSPECKEKEKKSHVMDWFRRLFTRHSGLRCRDAGSTALL
jgi:hypothetical protein